MIYVLGSINLDMIATAQRLPVPGETVSGDGFETAPGGKGANQALAAARAGSKVKMIGAVGNDSFGKQALSELRKAHVDLSNVRDVAGPSGIAIILVVGNGENVIVIIAGANAQVDEAMALQTIAQMSSNDILVMVQEIPAETLKVALEAAKAKGITSMLNIAPVTPQTRQLADLADIIVANETEFSHLVESQTNSHENTAKEIARLGTNWVKETQKTLIITLGRQGALAFTPTQKFTVKALDIVPVDTVGAGDTFCGYLAAGLEQGHSLEAALKTAAVAGSLACLEPGAQPAIPQASEVNAAQEHLN